MTAKEYLQQLERADVIIEQKMKEQADLEELSKCVRAIDYGKDRVSSSGTGDAPFVFLSTPSARRATAKTEKNISAFVSL